MSSYFCGADRSSAGAFSIRRPIPYQGIDEQVRDKASWQFKDRPLGGCGVRVAIGMKTILKGIRPAYGMVALDFLE